VRAAVSACTCGGGAHAPFTGPDALGGVRGAGGGGGAAGVGGGGLSIFSTRQAMARRLVVSGQQLGVGGWGLGVGGVSGVGGGGG
jgi:hypothetical protein